MMNSRKYSFTIHQQEMFLLSKNPIMKQSIFKKN